MRAIVLGYHQLGCVGLDALQRHGYDVVAVFTHTDSPEETIWFDSVAEHAAASSIQVFAPEDINHPVWVEKLKAMEPDIIFSFYYRQLVKAEILAIPSKGCYNLHGSMLPAYRGRCPVNWVLVNGEQETGVTLHEMTPRPDDGNIVGQEPVSISSDDTALTLHKKMAKAAAVLLNSTLPLIREGKQPSTPQDSSKASYYGGRKPADGLIDWTKPAAQIHNLVRAVARPYPGAFTDVGGKRLMVWRSRPLPALSVADTRPGTIISTDPLQVACGSGVLEITEAQIAGEAYKTGSQVAADANMVAGARIGRVHVAKKRRKKVMILGVNGFIGNALSERLLSSDDYDVYGMDLNSDNIQRFMDNPRFHFEECDISIHREWLEYHVRKCDVILPLIAIATPIEYTRNPLRVFELDFEENLRVVRYCAKYGKRIIFPSTSEVYGMCNDEEFDEESSNLVLGPIRMQRWIYSCSKQLLDRVIWAYGEQQGLKFTLFRPFNWIGPRLDTLESARIGSSRAITQMIMNLVEGTPIQLVDGGEQKRCFTDVDEGIECLFRIIEDKHDTCNGRIFNIGNPENEASIRSQAEMLIEKFEQHPLRDHFPPTAGMRVVDSGTFYGKGYQDVLFRRPSIRNAQKVLNWTPTIPLEESVHKTLDFFLREHVEKMNE